MTAVTLGLEIQASTRRMPALWMMTMVLAHEEAMLVISLSLRESARPGRSQTSEAY